MMMVGVNTLTMCEAELVRIVQYYFDTQMFGKGEPPFPVTAGLFNSADSPVVPAVPPA
jgi:hypothetical protein